MNVVYNASPTLSAFHLDDSFVRGVMGPVGSGKSVACCMEIVSRASRQEPSADGKRKSRWAIVRNCYDDATEILTERRGWVLFKDLTPEDAVATLGADGRSLTFEIPTYHYAARYTGEMIGLRSEGVDLLVTPDHKLWTRTTETRKRKPTAYRHVKACDIYGKTNYFFQRRAEYAGGDDARGYSEKFFEFLGFWFAEGYAGKYFYPDRKTPHRRFVVSQKWNVEYVESLLAANGLKYGKHDKGGGNYNFTLALTDELIPLIDELALCGKATDKRIPRWIIEAPAAHLRAFVLGYSMGDGHIKTKRNAVSFVQTSSRGMADDLQEICFRAGLVTNLNLHGAAGSGGRVKSTSDAWRLTILDSRGVEPRTAHSWFKQDYDGMVYCVEVSTHVVYVRRNGRTMWCGQTYGELFDTTWKTWSAWFPPGVFGEFNKSEFTFLFRHGDIEAELLFRALDRPEHVAKLLSLELTGAWINEAREVPKAILDGLTMRVGRYPSKQDGGCAWTGILMDTNPPDEDHWWYRMAEEATPVGWRFFRQPGGLRYDRGDWLPNELAENIDHLDGGYEYYLRQVPGKSHEWVQTYLGGQYGVVGTGRPVYPEYNDLLHAAPSALKPVPGSPLYLGWDFGLTPAAVLGQVTARGQLLILREWCADSMGIRQFARDVVKPDLARDYPGYQITSVGDPAGNQRAQTDQRSCLQELAALGIPTSPSHTNAFVPRREAVAGFLTGLVDGRARMQLDPSCNRIRRGFLGKYYFERVKVSGDERFKDAPCKNLYSHPHDALQYLCMRAQAAKADDVKPKARPRRAYRPGLQAGY